MGFLYYFAQCSALMISFVFILRWIFPYSSKLSPRTRSLLFGLIFGVMGVFAMLTPYKTSLLLDVRLECIYFSSVFGGPLSVLLTSVILGVYRLFLGGSVLIGICLIASGTLISLAAYYVRLRYPRLLDKYSILVGLLLGVQSIIWVYIGPFEVADWYFRDYYLPYALFHTLAIPFFYSLISYAIKRFEIEKQLRDSEASLLHYKDNLEELVEARTLELAAKNKQLKEAKEAAETANRTKGEFLANMSHEIRTPLNAVIGLSHLLQRTELTEQQQGYVDKTLLSAKNLLSLINDVLDFSKIEAGKVTLERIEFDLYEVLNQISNLVGFKAYDKGLKLSFSIHHEVPQMLIGDPFRLIQVLLNLSNNAVKFTDRGEISFEASVLEKDDSGYLLEFAVRDTGIGIPKEQHHKLFREFTQTDMSITRVYGGTGLGLVISKNLVQLMGGGIKAESEEGRGSRFVFTARFGRYEGSAFMDKMENAPLQALRVLTICDNAEMKLVMKSQLEQIGFVIHSVETGAEAIALLLRGERYDLVLIDWKLRSENAVRLSEQLKSEAREGVPIIVLVSAYHEPEWESLVQSSAIEKVLHYPMSQSQLYNEMVVLFQEHFVRKQNLKEADRSEKFAALHHSTLLLVEDNEINQQVALELLKDVGARVDVASNGLEAVKLAENTRYDAILMDLQMPVMSGYEAARKIRGGGMCAEAPIIAMTADALKSVEDEVYRAGMNAHITKPFDPIQLFGVLQRMIRSSRAGGRPTESPAGPLPEQTLPDLPGLDVIASIKRLNRNRELYLRILRTFEQRNSESIEEIRDALRREDKEAALLFVHSLKGVAANIGASGLAEATVLLEDSIKEDDADGTERHLQETADRLNVVLRSISQLVH
ncbi:response regulator [Cohnella sp. AR92]|uniref:response regulator n=1 Tax=Cohnella sp. AR92 TaxID=648716 RepID=UPI0013153BF5|nr:response regulator [Cohnella sp. AR92]